MKKLNLFFLLFLLSRFAAFSQNPSVVNGVATYQSNINIGRKFLVPNEWKKIVIKANVTITGSFYMPTRTSPIEIMGESRKTSILQGDGSRPTDDGINGRTYSAIRADKSPDIYVHDLTVTKPMKFHIHGGFGNVTVERCDIFAGSETHTTDGIHGGVNKTIVKDCYINVYDDALYTIECKLVENTTIVHNKNGGPFMTSWGNGVPDGHVCVIRNCTVIAGHNETGYNHGVVSWAGKSSASNVKETVTLKFEGTFEYIVPSGKKASTFYTIGRPNDPGLDNGHIIVDGQCFNKNSIDLRSSTNSSVTFKNCDVTIPTPTLTNITDLAVTSPSCTTVNLTWGDVFGETGYRILRKTPTSAYVTLANVAVNSKSYVDASAEENTTYQYMVRPMQGDVEAAVSNTPQILTTACQVSDITDLVVTSTSCTSANLTWTDIQGETGYRIRRKLATDLTFANLGDVPANTRTFKDTEVDEKTSYIYTVRPLKDGLTVANSNQVQVLIPSCTITGLDQEQSETGVFYPNPVQDQLNLPKSQGWGVFTLQGQLLKEGDSKDIDVSELPCGAYLLKTEAYHHFIKQ